MKPEGSSHPRPPIKQRRQLKTPCLEQFLARLGAPRLHFAVNRFESLPGVVIWDNGGGRTAAGLPDVMKVSAIASADSGGAKNTGSWIMLTSPRCHPVKGIELAIFVGFQFSADGVCWLGTWIAEWFLVSRKCNKIYIKFKVTIWMYSVWYITTNKIKSTSIVNCKHLDN